LKRLEVQRAKQDKIRLGLLAEEKPRLTKSNFMRVLGQDAVLAPSMIEKEMAKQVEERQKKHRDLIAATKLTEEERRAKKDRKLREDTSVMARVAVFK
jgi:U4/U6 small nuclear ribonucleoprotein PRP3